MSALDRIVAFVKAVSSTVEGENSEARYNVTGAGGFRVGAGGAITNGSGDDGDDAGEQASSQEGYASLGVVGRPLPPDGNLFAEAAALRTDDGLLPFGWRDLRLSRAVNPGGGAATPTEGQLMFAGYGGAFLSHAMAPDAPGSNISTWYLPFDFDGDGVPQKAHVVSMDPTPGNSTIQLVHADGVVVALTEDAGGGAPGITWAVDDATFGSMKPGEVTISANKIMLKGNVYVGAQAEAGLPLLAGAASPPCPSLFVSPV